MKRHLNKIKENYPQAKYDDIRQEIILLKKDDYSYFISRHKNRAKTLGYSLQIRYYNEEMIGKHKAIILADTALCEYKKLQSVLTTIKTHDLKELTDEQVFNIDIYNPERVKH